MQSEPDSGEGATYQFVFAGLPENVEYYVTAGPLVSSRFRVRVVDLPSVKDISVTYHYPAWTGIKLRLKSIPVICAQLKERTPRLK